MYIIRAAPIIIPELVGGADHRHIAKKYLLPSSQVLIRALYKHAINRNQRSKAAEAPETFQIF